MCKQKQDKKEASVAPSCNLSQCYIFFLENIKNVTLEQVIQLKATKIAKQTQVLQKMYRAQTTGRIKQSIQMFTYTQKSILMRSKVAVHVLAIASTDVAPNQYPPTRYIAAQLI
eukprot:TRINITY_DN13592_c0_g1_i1.p3 TRINITY_DN13592_c0_g1~~TRINITY_DN13592_c0_g1_i1.p3  ORF type:complete len:114 (-),score=2.23 TRINITY_DN13592_c0_g1_i1:38-379(-)